VLSRYHSKVERSIPSDLKVSAKRGLQKCLAKVEIPGSRPNEFNAKLQLRRKLFDK
jgi:hypothetical protein